MHELTITITTIAITTIAITTITIITTITMTVSVQYRLAGQRLNTTSELEQTGDREGERVPLRSDIRGIYEP